MAKLLIPFFPRDQKYWVFKVYINTLKHNQELKVYKHLASVTPDLREEPGGEHVRQMKDVFQLKGPNGIHDVLIMKPLGMSLRTFQEMQTENVFKRDFVSAALGQVLLGLHFIHEANVVHTGKFVLQLHPKKLI